MRATYHYQEYRSQHGVNEGRRTHCACRRDGGNGGRQPYAEEKTCAESDGGQDSDDQEGARR